MIKKALGFSSILLIVSLLVACSTDEEIKIGTKKAIVKNIEMVNASLADSKFEGRWYTNTHLILGSFYS